MGHGQRRRKYCLQHEIPVRDGIHAVFKDFGKPQVLGHLHGVKGIRGSGQGCGSQRTDPHPDQSIRDAGLVAHKHPCISQKVLGQDNRLRRL